MKFLNYCLFILVVIAQNAIAQESFSCQKTLSYIENHLPKYGVLKSSENFIYVDLNDDYIHQIIPFIQEDGFETPPYFENRNLVGAHITIGYPYEMIKYGIREIYLPEKVIHFIPKECQIVHPLKLHGINEIYLIVVESLELDQIRQELGLPKKKYDFHITVGIKPQ